MTKKKKEERRKPAASLPASISGLAAERSSSRDYTPPYPEEYFDYVFTIATTNADLNALLRRSLWLTDGRVTLDRYSLTVDGHDSRATRSNELFKALVDDPG